MEREESDDQAISSKKIGEERRGSNLPRNLYTSNLGLGNYIFVRVEVEALLV